MGGTYPLTAMFRRGGRVIPPTLIGGIPLLQWVLEAVGEYYYQL